MGTARMKPLIQKYAPAAAGLLGNYKDEILGAVGLGSFMFSSVKQPLLSCCQQPKLQTKFYFGTHTKTTAASLKAVL